MRRSERPIFSLPRPLLLGFLLALSAQLLMHNQFRELEKNNYQPLGQALSSELYRHISMGSVQLLSYLLSIRLQLHDNQAGRHIRYDLIDYDRLIVWLDTIHQMNPRSEYPMLLAARIYSQTTGPHQLRKILDFIDRKFSANPQLFWRHQAEATVVAKHQLKDLKLAMRMAEKLFNQPKKVVMPQWARDMHFLILADLNQYETSIAIIMALLQDKSITDPDERHFLRERLLEFQQKLSEIGQNQ